jgi:hypothetical protein
MNKLEIILNRSSSASAARNMLHCTLLTDRLHLRAAWAFTLVGHNGALFIILECTFLPGALALTTSTPAKLGYMEIQHVLCMYSRYSARVYSQ